ncbi:MAG: IgGFc-binding protein [Myxococcota bacterium]
MRKQDTPVFVSLSFAVAWTGGCGSYSRQEMAATAAATHTAGSASNGGDGTGGGPGFDSEDDDAGDESGEGKFDVGSPGGTGAPTGPTCSSDLKRIEDSATGELIEACGPGEGCLDGACVEACAAAGGSGGSIGCDFLLPTSPFYGNGVPTATQAGPCHAMMIANTWDTPVQLELSRDGQSVDAAAYARLPSGIGSDASYAPLPASGIPAGEVAVVFLAHRTGSWNETSLECPVPPMVVGDTAIAGTDRGVAFELSTDAPVQLYDILPFGGAASWLPSASLIYPTTSWGTDYVVVNPHDTPPLFGIPADSSDSGTQWMLVVASQDDTTVTVRMNQPAIYVGGINTPTPGADTNYALDAGESIQFASSEDPTGSVIVADAPIAVFAGNTYLRVTTEDAFLSGQDSAHQQLSDVHALGSAYVGSGVPSRLPGGEPESALYRVVGITPGTQLTYDPIVPTGAPTTIDAGEIVEFETRALFSVQSQSTEHPFSFTQYMSGAISGQPGCAEGPDADCALGDDEWIVVVPDAQFLESYSFFVDPTYGTTSLVLTRVRGPDGFAEVEVGCLGSIESWTKAGAEGIYEVAHVELFRGGTGTPGCQTSQHTVVSTEPFGLAVWGVDSFASYGYPGGAMLRDLNDVDVLPEG